MNDPAQPKRQPGAQKGNTNALKHGFYSRKWKLRDHKGLDQIEVHDLTNEIALMRVFIRRLVEAVQDDASQLTEYETIRGLSLAANVLNRLIRTQNKLVPPDSELWAVFNQAIEEVTEEYGLNERLNSSSSSSRGSNPLPTFKPPKNEWKE